MFIAEVLFHSATEKSELMFPDIVYIDQLYVVIASNSDVLFLYK